MNKAPYPNREQLEALYAQREAGVAALALQDRITAADVRSLDRIGRCKVANEHWALCDEDARQALRDDSHHFVRACADLAG
jgi:hypothetical protein